MTDTPEETDDVATDPTQAYCRHCGQPSDAVPGTDWLCKFCEGYQDTMACPVCSQPARISLLPEGTAPPPHAPARRRKGA